LIAFVTLIDEMALAIVLIIPLRTVLGKVSGIVSLFKKHLRQEVFGG